MAIDPIMLGVGAAAAAGGVLSYGMFVPRSGVFGPVVWRGPDDRPRVALTFDDGPWPGETERILDLLGEHGATATFFVIGRYAADRPRLIERMHAEGHQIGNHSWDHSRAGLFRFWRYWDDQVARTDGAVAAIIGERPRFFRPPMGFKSPPVFAAARRHGHVTVAWSRRGYDGIASSPERIERAVFGTKRPIGAGEIVLLHDGRDPASGRAVGATASALPAILRGLKERGLDCVRLDGLLNAASDRAVR